MNYDLERKIQEKVLEIDKIKSTKRGLYPMLGIIPIGFFMTFWFYPNWLLVGFGIVFTILGFTVAYEIQTGMPERLAKAEDEYETLVTQAGGRVVREDIVEYSWVCEYCGREYTSEEETLLHEKTCQAKHSEEATSE